MEPLYENDNIIATMISLLKVGVPNSSRLIHASHFDAILLTNKTEQNGEHKSIQ